MPVERSELARAALPAALTLCCPVRAAVADLAELLGAAELAERTQLLAYVVQARWEEAAALLQQTVTGANDIAMVLSSGYAMPRVGLGTVCGPGPGAPVRVLE